MLKILGKLHLIQKDIEKMEKDGYNDFNKYNYLSETQITYKLKNLFDKYGVLFHYQSEILETKPYVGAKGDTQFLVSVNVDYSFYDIESGESLKGKACGQGADKGDKGIYKAITGAIKYIFMKTFSIPTGDDAEKDSPEIGNKPQPTRQTNNYNQPNSRL